MPKLLALILSGIIFTLLAFPQTAVTQERSTFKVGVIVPLTGPVADFGIAAKNGIELAKRENSELFANVEFFFEDSQYDNNKALSSYQKLKNSDGVSVIYIWGYGPSQAVVPVAEKEKFPLIVISAERESLLGKNYSLRFCYYIDQIALKILDYLRAHDVKHMGIVKAELAYMNGLIESLKANIKPEESIDIVDTYQPSETDFKSTIAKLRVKKFDSVGVFLVGGQVSQFYRQIHQQHLDVDTFGTDFFDSRQLVLDAQGTMTGAVFAAPYSDPEFVERYQKMYGNDLQVAWAANGYEFAILTAKLFGNARETLTAEQIVKRYESSNQEQGIATRYKFNESPKGSGFDFKVVARRVEVNRIVDVID